MQNRFVRRSLVVVLAALGIAAAGCGATGEVGDATSKVVASGVAGPSGEAASLVEAAQVTGSVDTQKIAITVQTDPADGDPSVSITSSGEIDATNGRAHVRADIAGTVGGRSGDATVEAVYDGDTVYVKAPFTEHLGDTPWIKVTSPRLAALAGELAGGVEREPGSLLAFLEGAGGPVTTIGTEEVRGVSTRHVAVDLDVQRVLDQADATRRDQLEEHLADKGVALDALASIPAEAWIDDAGYVRRLSVSFDLSELGKVHPDAAEDVSGVVTETIELYDFDEPVDIEVPPASEVTAFDLSELLSGHGKNHTDGN